MQTFLPYPAFHRSAECLDRARLGKQRIECKQILRTLLGHSDGWANHPAVEMWRGYEISLCIYAQAICTEWRWRGYKDAQLPYFTDMEDGLVSRAYQRITPRWMHDPDFHASHRSNLLRKDPEHYGKFGWEEPDDLPYVWPMPGPFVPRGTYQYTDRHTGERVTVKEAE